MSSIYNAKITDASIQIKQRNNSSIPEVFLCVQLTTNKHKITLRASKTIEIFISIFLTITSQNKISDIIGKYIRVEIKDSNIISIGNIINEYWISTSNKCIILDEHFCPTICANLGRWDDENGGVPICEGCVYSTGMDTVICQE